MAKKAKTSEKNEESTPSRWKHLAWILLACLWAGLAAALLSHDPSDWPSHAVAPHNPTFNNWCGPVGAVVSYKAYLMAGPGIWLAMVGALAALIRTAMRKPITQFPLRVAGIVFMAVATSAILGLISASQVLPAFLSFAQHNPEGAGGLIAIFINSELIARFNHFGAMLVLITAFWLGALLAVDQIVLAVPKLIGRMVIAIMGINIPRPVLIGRFAFFGRGSRGGAGVMDDPSKLKLPLRGKSKKALTDEQMDDGPIDEEAGGLGGTESFVPEDHVRGGKSIEDDEAPEVEAELVEEAEVDEENSAADAPGAPGVYVAQKKLSAEELRAKFKSLPINFAPRNKAKTPPPRELDLSGYRFPEISTLEEPETGFTVEMEKFVRDQAMQLEAALQQYRIDGEVVGIDSGPVITLFDVRLAPGTKVAQLNAISSDLARSMRAHNIRIVPNTVGKDTIGIEVPNHKKEKVRLKELMTVNSDSVAKMRLPMFLGKDASGNPLIGDLSQMPHMLIAGTTGSGKSVCMNSIIMSFLFTKRPDELKMVLVDPKMVEMSQFKDVPHLMCPVVTDMSKAAAILEWAVTKMDERYELLAEAGVRDIIGYNALGWEEIKERMQPASEAEEIRIPKKLPYLVFIIDELADLMMTNKEVESFIVRIAQKARAVGIHLILATQRPQANVVTGLIKSNMPCRVSFKVASGMDSRIVLDQKGAELLLGQGDMLYLSPGGSKLTRAQGTLVDDAEIRRTVKFLKTVSEQSFEPQLVQLKAPGLTSEESSGERDPLFEDAVRVVLETQRGSVSLLQRRLTIGYSRASRLIEQIGEAGIIGEYKGSQAREVNMTLDEWDALKAQASEGAEGVEGRAPDEKHSEELFDTSDADESDDDDSVPDEIDGEYRN